jgi:hypothetical protein
MAVVFDASVFIACVDELVGLAVAINLHNKDEKIRIERKIHTCCKCRKGRQHR